MSVHESGTAVRRNDLQAITAVGGVRAHRIRRDTECDSIYDIANAQLDVLQQVWSVGPHFARVIKGSAQGLIEKAKSESENEFSTDERVAVVIPGPIEDDSEGVFSVLDEAGLDTDEQMDLITECVTDAGVDLETDNVRILATKYSTNVIEWWVDRRAKVQSLEGTGEVTVEFRDDIEAPWDKYADAVNYKAAQDRNEELVRRANKVVVVCAGRYTDNLIEECERQSTEHGGAVRWDVAYEYDPKRPDVGLMEWTEDDETEYEYRGFEVSDVETWERSASTYTGPGSYESRVKVTMNGPSGVHDYDIRFLHEIGVDADVGNEFTVSGAEYEILGMKEVPVGRDNDSSEQDDPDGLNVEEVGEQHSHEERGVRPREGSELDFEPEGEREFLTQEPAAVLDEDSRLDKNDLEDADPGGGKVDEYIDMSV